MKLPGMPSTAYISVGSNIGERLENCKSAATWLNGRNGIRIIAHSRYFYTEPVGYIDQPWFVNAVFAVETELSPLALLETLQLAQRAYGRPEAGIRFGPRVLDLDILFYNDMIMDDPGLVIPHPRLAQRRFVLEPLCDIAPELVHPVLGISARKLLEGLLPGGSGCEPIDTKSFYSKNKKDVLGDLFMKFFIDTANVDEIRDAHAMGMVDGVTTNPTLIARSGRDFREVIAEICEIVDGPVSAEAVSLDAEGMIAEARDLAKIHKNIVVKIPMTVDGLKAVGVLSAEGISTNVTLVFSSLQALMAAKAGATYVSPFVGRLDDLASDGMEIIEQIVTIYNNYGFQTEIIVASIRNPIHVLESALIGADIATIPYDVIRKLAAHPLTDKGIEAFLADWDKRKK